MSQTEPLCHANEKSAFQIFGLAPNILFNTDLPLIYSSTLNKSTWS